MSAITNSLERMVELINEIRETCPELGTPILCHLNELEECVDEIWDAL